jgi:KDO2-lipid IV(A) lauroyltransferase
MSKEKFEFFLFRFFSFLIKLLGLSFSRRLGKAIGTFAFYFIPIRKAVVIQNLATAFPDKTLSEIKKIAKKNFQNIFITFFEFMYVPFSTKEEIKKIGVIENPESLKKIIDAKKGVVLFTAHFGSWEIGAFLISTLLEIKLYELAKRQSNNLINDWLTKAREVHGNKMIWVGPSVRHLIEVLKKGEVVGLLADQRGPIDSPRIKFFGKPTAFPIGSATIAARTNSNVVFIVAIRQKDFNYKIVYEILDNSTLPIDNELRAIEINQRYANFLEKIISQHPEQYFWMHKLWKY